MFYLLLLLIVALPPGAEVVECSTHTCHQKARHHLIPKLQVEFYLLLTSAVVTPHKKKVDSSLWLCHTGERLLMLLPYSTKVGGLIPQFSM